MTHAPMDSTLNESVRRVQERLAYLAWRRYQIPAEIAEDLAQAAHLTYLEVRHRYVREEEHPQILVGIFRNKCREYVAEQVRGLRGLRAACRAALAGESAALTPERAPEDGMLGHLVDREEGQRLLESLSRLRPESREMFRLITEEGMGRTELARHYGINKNTLDSRLRTYRQELRRLLEDDGR